MVLPGEKFGNYEVLANAAGEAEVLGSGSGGTTLKVRHVHLDTIAAVKILRRRAQASSREGQGFLSEARSAASLTHPHIARILDFGENAAQLYYVMDLCEGGSLEDLRRARGAPSHAVALSWLHQAASALAHAHAQNILHRDIKPSNLLIAREGDIAALKLIDFGLAGKTDPDSANPTHDPVIGTPLFAAPEQLRGQAEKASDVFSLGASFLWMLTGTHLDSGDLAKVIDGRLAAQSYGPLLATLPLPWQEVLGAMLLVDPTQRPIDGAAVGALVDRCFAAEFPLVPVPWTSVSSEVSAAETSTPEDPLDAWEADPSHNWATAWTLVGTPTPDGVRTLFKATSAHEPGEWDVQLFVQPGAAVEELLIPQGYLLKRHAAGLGLGQVLLRKGAGWFSVAWPALTGQDALDWLRSGGVPPASDLLPRIRALAGGLDAAGRVGLDAFELHPALLHLLEPTEMAEAGGFAISVLLPLMQVEKSSGETASTISGSVNAPLPIRFAACIYHLAGGRPAPPAAFLNNRAYPAVPRLSERSNRYLGQVIAGVHPVASCMEIVDRLSMEERLPGVTGMASETVSRSMFSTSASMTASATRMPPPSSPAETLSRPPQLPSATAAATAATAPAKKSKAGLLVGVLLVGLLLVGGAGGAGWYFLIKKPADAKADALAKANALLNPPGTTTTPDKPGTTVSNNTTSTNVTPPTPPPVPSGEMSKLVKVPSQAATLVEAIAKCSSGGTIEVAGGTYKEAFTITKPLTLTAFEGAVLEGNGAANSLIAVKGSVEVKITGLVIRDASREATGSPENSPPLMLVADGANVTLDRCVIDSGMGSGISLINRSTAKLSGCRIVRNRWVGLQVSAGSSADLDQTSVLENRTGVLASDPRTMVRISSGSIVSRSSRNGIEVNNGAGLNLSGCEVSNSQSGCGILANGEGSSVDASGKSTISDNKLSGISLTASATLKLEDCQLERNREHGIHSVKGGALTAANSRFENGLTGLFVDGGSGAVKVDRCDFSKHGDSGVVFAGVKADLTNSSFNGNSVAAIFADGASGSAKTNRVNPGPADDVILLDNAGDVTREGNTVGE